MLLTRLLGVRAADHLRAVLDGLLAVERPLRGKAHVSRPKPAPAGNLGKRPGFAPDRP
eukprot:COSAG04_NODE_1200_length_7773_cov_5.364999_7_plen_58_part_00